MALPLGLDSRNLLQHTLTIAIADSYASYLRWCMHEASQKDTLCRGLQELHTSIVNLAMNMPWNWKGAESPIFHSSPGCKNLLLSHIRCDLRHLMTFLSLWSCIMVSVQQVWSGLLIQNDSGAIKSKRRRTRPSLASKCV